MEGTKMDFIEEDKPEEFKPDMKVKTSQGLATPMPQSDLQRNNQILLAMAIALYMVVFITLWVIWKVVSTGAVNNYISACV